MTFYVFTQSHGFDRATASRHDTLEDAGYAILGDDQHCCGVDEIDGEFVPWRQPHRGPRKWLTSFARSTTAEALEAIARSDAFGLECFDEQQAARYEAEGEE